MSHSLSVCWALSILLFTKDVNLWLLPHCYFLGNNEKQRPLETHRKFREHMQILWMLMLAKILLDVTLTMTLDDQDGSAWTTRGSASLQDLLLSVFLPTPDWIIHPELLCIAVLRQTGVSGHLDSKFRWIYHRSPTHPKNPEHQRLLALPGQAEVNADGAENVNKGEVGAEGYELS